MKQFLFKIIFLLPLFIFIFPVSAQNKFTISGNIKDARSGEELIGATIIIKELRATGVNSNAYGFYSITLPEGNYTLQTQYLGYEPQLIRVTLNKNQKIDVELSAKASDLKEIEVSDERPDKNVSSTEMGTFKLDVRELNSIPVLFGEKDILKTIQLLPGIKSAGEGNSGFYVRGGGADQNLILLDEANIYNAGHLLGFFSVFNSDAIKEVSIIKGGIPAEYGGRLSSVLDVKMNDGNSKKVGVTGGVGLISSRLTVEGPLAKGKGSFMVSGRRTYADMFLKLSKDSTRRQSKLYFYDFNVKANYQFSAKDRIYFSGYFGKDDFSFGNSLSTNWGNATATARWTHLFSDKLFLNTSFIFSDFVYDLGIQRGTTKFDLSSGIRDFNLKEDFQYYMSPKTIIKFGINSIHHTFNPGTVTVGGTGSAIKNLQIDKKYAYENAAYVSGEFTVTEKIKVNTGLRYSMFTAMGPGNVNSYDADGIITDSTYYKKNQIIKNYGGIEPRLSINYRLDEPSSIKFSYNRMRQYLNLLSNSTVSTPNDLWVPSSKIVQPQLADQVALGYFRNFKDNACEGSVEIYYKNMQHQVDYKPGADLSLNKNVESQLLFGRGYAYGAEFFLKKKYGRFNGWLGYTLSRSLRIFDAIDNGKTFSAKQDRIHDISIVGIYELNPKWTFSSTFVYSTGNAVSFPSGKYPIEGQVAKFYTERNGYRMPPYHRMDIGATYISKKTDKYEGSWNFSIYNVYARENAYLIFFQQDPNDKNKTQAVQLSLFRFIPSVSYNFKF